MTRVFISYSRKDLAFVERLAQDLKAAGLEVWYDLSGLEAGQRWGSEIQSAIEHSQYSIVVLSPDSVVSEWVEKEFIFALNQKIKIIPLLYRPCKLPMWVINLHYFDMQGANYKKNLSQLLNALGTGSKDRARQPVKTAARPVDSEKGGKRRKIRLFMTIGGAAAAVLLLSFGIPRLITGFSQNIENTPPPNSSGTSCSDPTVFCVGYVADVEGLQFSWNADTWEGVQRAEEELGIQAELIESTDPANYTQDLSSFAEQDYDLVIASSMMGKELPGVAAAFPDTRFAIVGVTYPNDTLVAPDAVGFAECIPNVMGQLFKIDQAAYLAGYLAAGMAIIRDPAQPRLGIFGGANMPGVTSFNVGFEEGMGAYNDAHSTAVRLLGWRNDTGEGYFMNTFVDTGNLQPVLDALQEAGADIVLPVGGTYPAAALDGAAGAGWLVIGVDYDGYESFNESRSYLLTSIRKRLDNAIFEIISRTTFHNFQGCTNFIGDISNGGVDLAPFHDQESQIPEWLLNEVAVLESQIRFGEIQDTGCVSYPRYCEADLYATP